MSSSPSNEPAVRVADVEAAAERIGAHVVRTPCVPSESVSQRLGFRLSFKAENLQHIGAFKARGATNAVLSLTAEEAACGVVTHSSGNHAAALSRAAKIRGVPAHVVMPANSARNKIAAVRAQGVEPVFCDPDAESRARTCRELATKTGATFVHPYDHPAVIAGQGTAGLEILEQVPDVDVILVPVGGGGLLSGVLTAVKARRPEVRVIAVEPEWADDARRSLESGKIEAPLRYDTIADGLRTPLGELTFPIIRDLLDDLVMVSEREIRDAMRVLAEEVHLVAEPSGAVTLAGAKRAAGQFAGLNVVAVVSGGNVDFGDCAFGA